MVDITSYRSGAGNISDLQGYMLAGVPVGLPCVQISDGLFVYLPSHIEKEMICYSHHQKVFVDSGAFGVFQKALKTGVQLNLDFDAIMERYQHYAFLGNFALVVPDCIGDQDKTLELQFSYREAIQNLIDLGADVLIPVQKGKRSPSQCWQIVRKMFGSNVRVAIPSNKAAFSGADIEDLLTCENPPKKIHLLGFTHASHQFVAKVAHLKGMVNDIDISCDGNRLRAMLGEGRKLTVAQRELNSVIGETIADFSTVDNNQMTDQWDTIHRQLGRSLSVDQCIEVANTLTTYDFPLDELIVAAGQGELMEWLEEYLPGFGEYPENELYKLVMAWESKGTISCFAAHKAFRDDMDSFFPEGYTFCPVPAGVARVIAVAQTADEAIPHVPVQRSMFSAFRLAA